MGGSNQLLLIRPLPFDDESWPGYLLRLSSANGLSGLYSISKLCGLKIHELIKFNPWEALEKLGIQGSQRIQLKSTPISSRGRKGGTNMVDYGRSHYSRVCRQCLRDDETPYIRVEWDRFPVVHCQEHLCLLLDTCPACMRRLSNSRKSITNCSCGFAFTAASKEPIPVWLSTMYRILDIDPYKNVDVAFNNNSEGDLLASKVVRKLINISRIGSGSSIENGQPRANGGLISIKELGPLEGVFENWPEGFAETLSKYRKQFNGKWSLIHPDVLEAGQFKELDSVVREFHRLSVSRSGKARKYAIPWTDDGDSYFSKNAFMGATGLSDSEVLRMISENLLAGTVVNDSKYECLRYAIPKRCALDFAESGGLAMDVAEASAWLGASERAICKLAKAGILTYSAAMESSRNWRFCPGVVEELRAAFVSGRRFNAHRHGQLISTSAAVMIVSKRGKSALARFMNAAMAGDVVRIRHCNGPLLLDQVFFELEAVASFEKSATGRPRKAPTVQELSGL